MGNNSKSAKAMAARIKEKDPDYYRKLSKLAKKPRGGKNTPGSFTSQTAKLAGMKGGSKSKRGPGKVVTELDHLEPILEYKVEDAPNN